MTRIALVVASVLAACATAVAGRVVEFPSGVTRLEKPIVLTPSDSGTVLRGAADGSSVLSGARELPGLVFTAEGNGVYSAPLESGEIDLLFVNGVRYDMARFPNRREGKNVFDVWSLSESRDYREDADALLPARVRTWAHPETGYLHAMHEALWGDMHWRIEGVGADGAPKLSGGWQNNRRTGPHKVFRFVENIREELDAPGEWFHDRAAKRLLVIPRPGTDLGTARLEAVRLRNLVELRGTPENPVRNVRIENLGFTGSARTFMDNREPLLRSDWTLYRGAAVALAGAADCTIANCRFERLGGNALIFDGYNRGHAVRNCRFEEIGASGIVFAGRPSAVRNPLFSYSDVPDYGKLDLTPGPKGEDYPSACTVEDCRFERTGRDEKQTAAVQISVASRITVRNAFIRRTPRAAINIGDGCFGGHLIEGCDVAETVLETSDHGAFNSWGRDRYWRSGVREFSREVARNPALPFLDAVEPTVIRGNRWRCDHGWDVDLDDGSTNYIIEDNDFLRGGLKLREGYRRIVRNNRARTNTLHAHCWPEASGDVVVSNLFEAPFMTVGIQSFDGATVADNVFLRTGADGRPAPTAREIPLYRQQQLIKIKGGTEK